MVENGRETLAGETLEEICPYDDRPVSPGGDSMTSSLECDLMIESLQRELDMVRLELEAIVLQQIPRAAINTGAGGGGEGEERPIGRNATDDVKVALINRGAGIVRACKGIYHNALLILYS
ncbi:PREDICTED: uncharacterized protein LOC109587461 [Amphimedon queenslandica]|uniref:Uncharacterized protein n=2 Tax=Amphimedon queenslandica TaxID=400682 RepID=A0AAN0JQE2_AMPQE|nr:PREDICTED: uncharacterized protein LOC109587461 [Amphimedon queenslandica]|eukprot:XP_019859267.1 PREDICTED: uncharacterized protein LOC109587461 [Amphimedon queenslandica]